ncbi:MAG: hypothetical protein IJL69_03780 [Oscillospiraceae bacterium]|nr:hypothetical protein [Oscillospiraceae bacterium]
MSPKELLYVEDALGREELLCRLCADSAARIRDPQLKQFVSGLESRHRQGFRELFGLLG